MHLLLWPFQHLNQKPYYLEVNYQAEFYKRQLSAKFVHGKSERYNHVFIVLLLWLCCF